MVHPYGNGTVAKAEVGIRDWGTDMIGLTILLFRVIWKIWELCIRKAVEIFKDGLMGHPKKNLESSCVDGNLDYELPAQHVSEGKNITS